MVSRSKRLLCAGAAALGIGALAVSGSGVATAAAPRASTASLTINGAGSTFVAPVMQGSWIPAYTKAHPDVQINYNPVGSGAGITLWTQGNTDFAGSDALLTPVQENTAKQECGGGVSGGVFKIPVVIGAVALFYNIPGVPTGLRLSPDIVAGIFLGQITSWDDARIRRLNPKLKLPHLAIQTVHRADGSGTTFITTNYLAAVSPAWKSGPGAGALVTWPNGTGAKGSAGVAAAVAQTQGAIGYADLAYAVENKLSYASIENKKGQFILPGIAGATIAAASFARSMPADLQQVIVNSSAKGAYPITGYSYIFMCTRQTSPKGQALVNFVHYVVTTGQKASPALYYAPIPPNVQKVELAALAKITMK